MLSGACMQWNMIWIVCTPQAGSLLYFMFEEAPRMDLWPEVRLSASERQRLKRYAEDIFVRYCAVSSAATQTIRPLHLSVLGPQAIPARS